MTNPLSGCRWVISGRNAHQFFSSRPWGSLLPRGPRRGNPAAEDCHRRSKTRSRLLVTSGVPSPFHPTQNRHPDLRISLGGRVAAIASIVPERALLWRRRLSDAVDERRDERCVALAGRWGRVGVLNGGFQRLRVVQRAHTHLLEHPTGLAAALVVPLQLLAQLRRCYRRGRRAGRAVDAGAAVEEP